MITINAPEFAIVISIIYVLCLILIWFKTSAKKRIRFYYSVMSLLFLVLALGMFADISYTTYKPATQSDTVTILYDNSTSMSYHNISLSHIEQSLEHLRPRTRIIAQN